MATAWNVILVSLLTIWAAATVEAFFTKPTFCKRPEPWSLDTIHPEFHVFTRNTTDQVVIHNDTEVPDFVQKMETDGLLRADRPVTFIVHGFVGFLPWNREWVFDLKDALLKIEDQTVLYVVWSKGADVFYDYGESASNTQTVAAVLSKLSLAILNSNTFKGDKDLLYLHCIGHSLGAHICGQAGRESQIFDRATGLDPAGPGFEQCTDHLNIDVDSATCVDNIHTDGTSKGHWNPIVSHFGTLDAWGHIDFYPNGGGNQPGCFTNDVPPCSHVRVLSLFQYTVENGPTVCESAETCQGSGNCANEMQAMGYYSSCHKDWKTMAGNFSLETGKATPYC